MVQEREYQPISGWVGLVVGLGLFVGTGWCVYSAIPPIGDKPDVWWLAGAVVSALLGILVLCGLQAIAPNESRVYLLFGRYVGSTRATGFFWVNPFFSKKKISLRVRNFETGSITTPETKDPTGKVLTHKSRSAGRPSKVNDKDGNPIEISAVVVWKVVNTAEAMFEVDDYEDYVAVQSEAALRGLAMRHPYDSEDHEMSLRGNPTEVAEQLKGDIQDRFEKAGVEVIEARISHIAYAPEIAAVMLQRQQAQAVVAARSKIVEGAVGMVHSALERLGKDEIIHLDEERRAAMVCNLLVVLCGHGPAQPVINAGTLHN
ncbi:MAG: SPFH domain-containing protein [Planctomycetaceae bacterium]|nr:SPFH domain-containing protein [Planctomycetaceae bacterium]